MLFVIIIFLVYHDVCRTIENSLINVYRENFTISEHLCDLENVVGFYDN